MSPSLWVLAIIILVAVCVFAAWCDELVKGTPEERKKAEEDLE